MHESATLPILRSGTRPSRYARSSWLVTISSRTLPGLDAEIAVDGFALHVRQVRAHGHALVARALGAGRGGRRLRRRRRRRHRDGRGGRLRGRRARCGRFARFGYGGDSLASGVGAASGASVPPAVSPVPGASPAVSPAVSPAASGGGVSILRQRGRGQHRQQQRRKQQRHDAFGHVSSLLHAGRPDGRPCAGARRAPPCAAGQDAPCSQGSIAYFREKIPGVRVNFV